MSLFSWLYNRPGLAAVQDAYLIWSQVWASIPGNGSSAQVRRRDGDGIAWLAGGRLAGKDGVGIESVGRDRAWGCPTVEGKPRTQPP